MNNILYKQEKSYLFYFKLKIVSTHSNMCLKSCELTGTALELYTLSYHRNIDNG